MKKLEELTLQEKLGQFLIIGFEEPYLTNDVKAMIKKYKFGNFILFKRNIESLEQLEKLTRELHKVVMDATGVMPFISIDQEGGTVVRIMHKAAFYPGSMTLAATSIANANEVGAMMGKHLMSLGINMNLAPSLDVNNNPKNPVIGIRSYSDNPDTVAKYGIELIKGMQQTGIIATAKHFPGHGDVEIDSHLGLPELPFDMKRLEAIELKPFKEAIAAGVKNIMSAHIVFKAIDEENPATLSKAILQGILRDKLKYKGLITSDCMEMEAIAGTMTTPVGVAAGIVAGIDMACVCHTKERQIDSLKMIKQAIDDELITMDEIDEKVDRILKYKNQVYKAMSKLFFNNKAPLDVFKDNKQVRFNQSVVSDSLTHVTGKKIKLEGKTILFGCKPSAHNCAEDVVDESSVLDLVKNIDYIDGCEYQVNEYDANLISKALEYDTVVFASFNAFSNPNQAKMINELNRLHPNLYVISARNPYDYLALEGNVNYYTVYECTPNSNRAIVNLLKGDIQAKGKLPVKLERHFNIGASVYIGMKEYTYSENIKYLEMLKANGVEDVFIYALHVGDNPKNLTELKKLINAGNKIGVKFTMDVDKKVLSKYKLPTNVYAYRLDYGFSAKEIADMINNEKYHIELNASITEKELLLELKELGVDLTCLRVSHNFYPKPYTGLAQDVVLEKNKMYKEFGLKVLAFVPSSNMHRGPVYEGLATIEDHRHHHLLANLSELSKLLVDDVCFGDAYASEEEIVMASNFNKDLVTLPIGIYKGVTKLEKDLIERVHENRFDQSDYFLRSSIRTKQAIKPFNTVERKVGDVTIDNGGFAIYQGEVSVVTKAMPKDERVNVVGKVLASKWLLDHIEAGSNFELKIVSELKR